MSYDKINIAYFSFDVLDCFPSLSPCGPVERFLEWDKAHCPPVSAKAASVPLNPKQ